MSQFDQRQPDNSTSTALLQKEKCCMQSSRIKDTTLLSLIHWDKLLTTDKNVII